LLGVRKPQLHRPRESRVPKTPSERYSRQAGERLNDSGLRPSPRLGELVVEQEIGDRALKSSIRMAVKPGKTVTAEIDARPLRKLRGLGQPALLQLRPDRNSGIGHEHIRREGHVVE